MHQNCPEVNSFSVYFFKDILPQIRLTGPGGLLPADLGAAVHAKE
jgi:hypothetical protein